MSENVSQEEKIDYIYANLKKQESRRTWGLISKWGFRICIIGYLYYFITIGLPTMIDNMIPDMPTFGTGSISENLGIDSAKEYIGNYFSK